MISIKVIERAENERGTIMMKQTEIVVLGAGYAGLLAALRLDHQSEASVTLVNAAPVFVERIRLHQQAAGQSVVTHSIPDLIKGTAIRFVQGWVTDLDPQGHFVTVNTAEGVQRLAYDTLVYALGSTIDRSGVEGVQAYAEVLIPGQTGGLHAKLAALPDGGRVVVCGGGLTGIESATELAESYPQLQVELVTMGDFGAAFSAAGRKHVNRAFERLGIKVRDNTAITRLEAGQVITDKGSIAYDVALWAGAFAVPELARKAGLLTTPKGQIVVDSYLRSVSHPDIFAIGDSASPADFQPSIRMACATALPMAMQAANNINAQLQERTLKPFHFRYFLRCVSLGRHDGLVQFVHSDDSPRPQILTGWLGALVKEQVCRFAFNTVAKERHSSGEKTLAGKDINPAQVA
jgi:NADH dehydrogenase FAD-containing subunit